MDSFGDRSGPGGSLSRFSMSSDRTEYIQSEKYPSRDIGISQDTNV
jgi:hypothetical protein